MGRDRFNRLKWGLKQLEGQVPASGPFFKFNQYLTGATKPTYTRDAASKPGGRKFVGIEAFAFADAAKAKIKVGISARADAKKVEILTAAGVTALSHEALTEAHTKRFGFDPAKAIVFKPDAQTDTQSTSQITGLKYNPREGSSYTFPFGRTGTDGEADRAAAIAAALNAVTTQTPTVSFKPERVRGL